MINRKVLWDPNEEECKNKNKKIEEWIEISRLLHADFDEMPVVMTKISDNIIEKCNFLTLTWRILKFSNEFELFWLCKDKLLTLI